MLSQEHQQRFEHALSTAKAITKNDPAASLLVTIFENFTIASNRFADGLKSLALQAEVTHNDKAFDISEKDFPAINKN